VVHLGDEDPTIIGDHVVVGHRAVLHGCTIEDHCLIGIQATVLDGAVIGRGSIVGAGAIVSAGMIIPPLSLVLGVPAKASALTLPCKIAKGCAAYINELRGSTFVQIHHSRARA